MIFNSAMVILVTSAQLVVKVHCHNDVTRTSVPTCTIV